MRTSGLLILEFKKEKNLGIFNPNAASAMLSSTVVSVTFWFSIIFQI
jgi:hypothetical protein